MRKCTFALILTIVVIAPGCRRPGKSNALESITDAVPERFGLTESTAHRPLLVAAVDLTNQLLSVDTQYQVALSGVVRDIKSIPVYLVHGESMGTNEYAAAPEEARCIILNADGITKLVRTFGFPYSDSDPLKEAHPAYGLYPTVHDDARKIVALVLMHEVGHIWLREHPPTANQDSDMTASLDPVLQAVGQNRNIELQADEFAAKRLKAAAALAGDWKGAVRTETDKLRSVQNPSERSFDGFRRLGRQMRAATDYEGFLFRLARAIPIPRLESGRRMSASHLDLYLRVYVIAALANPKPDSEGSLYAVQDAVAFDKYSEALQKIQATPVDGCYTGKYGNYVRLLRDPDIDIRRSAARDLRKEEPLSEEVLPALIDALEERYGEVPSITHVLQSLGRKAVPALIRSLKNQSARVRGNAALCLAQMGPENNRGATRTLAEALEDDDAYVREKAQLALSEHGLCKEPALGSAGSTERCRASPGRIDAFESTSAPEREAQKY